MGFPNVKTKPSSGNVLDHSTETAVTTAALGAQSVMPANESRTYLVFQNISDTLMRINFGPLPRKPTASKCNPAAA
jgi:hypothetical protein